jgi:hypothetical protein
MPLRPPAVLLATAILTLGIATAMLPAPGVAQQPAQPQTPGAATPARERPLPGRHIEGRIAFLRAELKITDAQQPAWERVAAAMRANAQQMNQMAQQMRGTRDQPRSAVQQLEQRAQFAETRASADKTFLAAFKPLYDSLSDDQKKTADELFARPARRGPRGHR